MRKIIAAVTFGLVLGVAGAANRDEQSPETRAYFAFSFGGEKVTPRSFHYGLRIDHDSRFVDGPVPALMQFDFTRSGLSSAHVNGMNVVRQSYKLRQAEEPAEEPVAEEPAEEAPVEEAPAEEAAAEEGGAEGGEPQGFLSKTWSGITGFFGGLFGGSDEEAPTETAEGGEGTTEEAAADAGETADGPFANYGLVDWGLLALGAVGIGYAAGEVSNSSESDDPAQPTGSTTSGGATPVGATPVGATPVGATPIGATPIGTVSGFFQTRKLDDEFRERLEWLDGGTGHMGDLNPQPE